MNVKAFSNAFFRYLSYTDFIQVLEWGGGGFSGSEYERGIPFLLVCFYILCFLPNNLGA